jgi:hypothetical protein
MLIGLLLLGLGQTAPVFADLLEPVVVWTGTDSKFPKSVRQMVDGPGEWARIWGLHTTGKEPKVDPFGLPLNGGKLPKFLNFNGSVNPRRTSRVVTPEPEVDFYRYRILVLVEEARDVGGYRFLSGGGRSTNPTASWCASFPEPNGRFRGAPLHSP